MMKLSRWCGRIPAVLFYPVLFAVALAFLGALGSQTQLVHAQALDAGPALDSGPVAVPAPMVTTVTAQAMITPGDVSAVVSTIRGIVGAAKGGHWAIVVGLVLTALVWVSRRYTFLLAKVPTKAVPWVSLAIAVAGSIGTALVTGAPVVDALLAGADMGAVSIASWELAGRHFLPDPPPKA